MRDDHPHVNPILQFRRGLGMTRLAFSHLAGVSHSTVAAIENGAITAPRSLFDGLERAGFDTTQLRADHRAWVASERVRHQRPDLLVAAGQ